MYDVTNEKIRKFIMLLMVCSIVLYLLGFIIYTIARGCNYSDIANTVLSTIIYALLFYFLVKQEGKKSATICLIIYFAFNVYIGIRNAVLGDYINSIVIRCSFVFAIIGVIIYKYILIIIPSMLYVLFLVIVLVKNSNPEYNFAIFLSNLFLYLGNILLVTLIALYVMNFRIMPLAGNKIEIDLKQLKKDYDKGKISLEEYNVRRMEILNKL